MSDLRLLSNIGRSWATKHHKLFHIGCHTFAKRLLRARCSGSTRKHERSLAVIEFIGGCGADGQQHAPGVKHQHRKESLGDPVTGAVHEALRPVAVGLGKAEQRIRCFRELAGVQVVLHEVKSATKLRKLLPHTVVQELVRQEPADVGGEGPVRVEVAKPRGQPCVGVATIGLRPVPT